MRRVERLRGHARGRTASREERRAFGSPGWGRDRGLTGLVGGGVAALLLWGTMAVSISGFTLRNPVELSVLMEPDVFLGGFFVALSVFLYAFLGGVVLGPIFGTLVNRAVRAGSAAGVKGAGDDAAGKEDLVVR